MFNTPEKIISRQTSDRLIATLDIQQYFTLDSTHVIHLLINSINIKYLLGIYNSILLNYIYKSRVQESGKVFAQVKTVNLKPLPIVIPDISDKEEKARHDEIVKLVDQMLQLNEELQAATVPAEQAQLKQRIQYTDNKINQLVYQLYNLTEEEIRIVEGN